MHSLASQLRLLRAAGLLALGNVINALTEDECASGSSSPDPGQQRHPGSPTAASGAGRVGALAQLGPRPGAPLSYYDEKAGFRE
jgi:hypothetical protein